MSLDYLYYPLSCHPTPYPEGSDEREPAPAGQKLPQIKTYCKAMILVGWGAIVTVG